MASYLDGTNGPTDKVVPLALARLEKMIENRLSDVFEEGADPVVKVKVVDAPADIEDSVSADPNYYHGLVDSIIESLTNTVQPKVAESEDDDVIHLQSYNTEVGTVPTNCDFFVGRMRCMHCGTVSRSDASTQCETFLHPEPSGRQIRIGDHIGPLVPNARSDYYANSRDNHDEDLHVLEGWECSRCHGVNWAEIVIDDEHVKSIWSVKLNQDTLSRAHLISSESVEIAAELTGRPPWTLLDEDILTILFDRL